MLAGTHPGTRSGPPRSSGGDQLGGDDVFGYGCAHLDLSGLPHLAMRVPNGVSNGPSDSIRPGCGSDGPLDRLWPDHWLAANAIDSARKGPRQPKRGMTGGPEL